MMNQNKFYEVFKMHSSKGFTTGLLTGAVVGGIMGMLMDPIKDKESKKLRSSAGTIVHSVGNIIDGIADMKS
jgi:gas vesicle protein